MMRIDAAEGPTANVLSIQIPGMQKPAVGVNISITAEKKSAQRKLRSNSCCNELADLASRLRDQRIIDRTGTEPFAP